MSNIREVNDDILKEWFNNREQDVFGLMNENDRKHKIYYDEISEKILNNIPKQNRNFVKNQLEKLDRNYTDYLVYWTEKYYRNGFCDGVELIGGCLKK